MPSVRRHSLLTDGLVVAAVELYLLYYLRVDLLSLATTTAGGDMGSHVWTARYFLETVLPSGRILSWMPEQLVGLPLFQLYFPLPFLLMAPLAGVVGIDIAFKWISVLGVLTLPLVTFTALRRVGARRPAPVLAAIGTLLFLFQEGNSVWGGNLASTLAGEFAYSIGLSLTVLFLGECFRSLRTRGSAAWPAVLLALVGLSHAYTLLFAGLASAFVATWHRPFKLTAAFLAKVYAIAFLLIGFWIVPLLAYQEHTTPYRDAWGIDGWRQLLPIMLWPALLLCGVGAVALLRARKQGHAGELTPLALISSYLVAAALLFNASDRLGVVDIRFLPFLQLGLVIAGAVALGGILSSRRHAGRAVLVVATLTMVWVDYNVTFLPQWIEWNYRGYQEKPGWNAFAEVNRYLREDTVAAGATGRVVFEHHPAHNTAGTIRAFENLPLFSGRGTLEGLYIQSSPNTPFVFYLQSELSTVASCPIPDYHCASLDVEQAAEHLRLFGVDQVVARSAEVQSALSNSEQYRAEAAIGPYSVFRLKEPADGWVAPLGHQPLALETDIWRELAFDWFRQLDVGPDGEPRFYIEAGTDLPAGVETVTALGQRPFRKLNTSVQVSDVVVEHDSIRFRTTQPGHPHLVKVSYHPRWRGNDVRVFRASPEFMVVYPEHSTVELTFGTPPIPRIGHLLTAIGVVWVGCSLWRRFRLSQLVLSRFVQPKQAAPRLAFPLTHLSPAWGRFAIVGLVGLLFAGSSEPLPSERFDRGMEHYYAAEFEQAEREFERVLTVNARSSAALHAAFYSALTAYRGERWQVALDRLARARAAYPESAYLAEIDFHLADCQERLGHSAKARHSLTILASRFPDSPWAARARERLKFKELPPDPRPVFGGTTS